MNSKRIILAGVAVALISLGVLLIIDGKKEAVAPAEPGAPSVPEHANTPTPTAPNVVEAQAAEQRLDGGITAAKAEIAPPASGPKPELEPSPFDSPDSKELQYAVELVKGPNTGPEQWRNAAAVFQKCVDANPHNFLCRRGVFAAWQRIDTDGGPPTALNGEMKGVDDAMPGQHRIDSRVLPP